MSDTRSMSDPQPQQPRPCEIHSNQFYLRGTWHGWFWREGRMYAMVEEEHGHVKDFDVSGCYSIKFTDKR